jgi:hypothetical protein
MISAALLYIDELTGADATLDILYAAMEPKDGGEQIWMHGTGKVSPYLGSPA